MKELEWNTIKYIDCLDATEGLPSLPDKSVDLCFTDPPWGYLKGVDGRNFHDKVLKARSNLYDDDFKPEWYLWWFTELERVCNGIIIVMGVSQEKWWYKNTDPVGALIVYFKNGTTSRR